MNMKQRIMALIIALMPMLCTGQVPKYIKTNYTGAPTAYALFNQDATKIQSIYYPTDFASMPSGVVTNIYLRIGAKKSTTNSVVYKNVRVKIGYTADSSFPHFGSYDTFKTGLTEVFYSSNHTFVGIDSIGNWMKFPCTMGNWAWNGIDKFVIQVSHGPEGTANPKGFDWMSSINTAPMRRSLSYHVYDSIRVYNNSQVLILDLGFDIATTGAGSSSSLRSFGLFPNPSRDGRFNISLEAHQAVKEVRVTVSNVTGQQVLRRQYAPAGNSFFKEIDLGAAAKGVYFVEILADRERIVRKLVVE
jgi:hypothetical protein